MTDEGKQLKEDKRSLKHFFSKNFRKAQDNRSTTTVIKDQSKYSFSEIVVSGSNPKSPSSQPAEAKLTNPLFVTKHDDSATTDGDLSIKGGVIINSDEDWWLAEAKHSGQEGYIPSNYVAEYKSDLDTEK